MKLVTVLIATIATIAAGSAFADSINQRQHRQGERIAQGVQSGELTKDEAKSLRAERKAIRTEERAYRADGKFTKAERKDVQQDLNQSSHDIYREKHNAGRR